MPTSATAYLQQLRAQESLAGKNERLQRGCAFEVGLYKNGQIHRAKVFNRFPYPSRLRSHVQLPFLRSNFPMCLCGVSLFFSVLFNAMNKSGFNSLEGSRLFRRIACFPYSGQGVTVLENTNTRTCHLTNGTARNRAERMLILLLFVFLFTHSQPRIQEESCYMKRQRASAQHFLVTVAGSLASLYFKRYNSNTIVYVLFFVRIL